MASQGMDIHAGFQDGHKALTTWADKLSDAQKHHGHGRQQLNEAHKPASSLPPSLPHPLYTHGPGLSPPWSSLLQSLHLAKSGCQGTLAGLKLADGAANDAITALNQSAFKARARQITTPGIDPLSAVSLAYTADNGPAGADPGVLSPNAMARASQQLAAMSPADE